MIPDRLFAVGKTCRDQTPFPGKVLKHLVITHQGIVQIDPKMHQRPEHVDDMPFRKSIMPG